MVPLKQAGNESSFLIVLNTDNFLHYRSYVKPPLLQKTPNWRFSARKIMISYLSLIKRLKWVLLWIEHDTLIKEMYLVPLKS